MSINYENMSYKKMRLTKDDIEDLRDYLEEYLSIFEKSKKHQKAHQKEPCHKCETAKELLEKLVK